MEIRFRDEASAAGFMPEGARIVERDGRRVVLIHEGGIEALLEAACGASIDDMVIAPPSLEEFFLRHFGGGGTA